MSAQHTKGPWNLVRHSWDASSVYASNGSRVAICRIDEEDVTEETQDACVAVNEANASLIAAAPELLEALKMLVSIYKEHVSISSLLEGKSIQEIDQYFDARHVIVDKAIDDAVSAIAKATMTGPSIADLVESGALPPPTRQAGR